MNRRDAALAFLALGIAPLSSFAAQPGKVWRVGIITSRPAADAFAHGMRDLGYIEGKNLSTDFRDSTGRSEDIVAHARELISLKVDVLVFTLTRAVIEVKKLTKTIPIVYVNLNDPVGSGIAASLARPGGNSTGLSLATLDTVSKQLEFLRTILPRLSRVAFLQNPDHPSQPALLKRLHGDAERLGIRVLPILARTPEDLDRAFAAMARGKSEAVIVAPDEFFRIQRQKIAALALQNSLPSTFQAAALGVDAGGLLSYGPNLVPPWRRAAVYVDKIFKGANPGDLPVEQPTIFELVLNIKTAKALGLTLPQSLLMRADRVIE